MLKSLIDSKSPYAGGTGGGLIARAIEDLEMPGIVSKQGRSVELTEEARPAFACCAGFGSPGHLEDEGCRSVAGRPT